MVDVTVHLYANGNDPIERNAWVFPKHGILNSTRDKEPVKEKEGKTCKDIRDSENQVTENTFT